MVIIMTDNTIHMCYKHVSLTMIIIRILFIKYKIILYIVLIIINNNILIINLLIKKYNNNKIQKNTLHAKFLV